MTPSQPGPTPASGAKGPAGTDLADAAQAAFESFLAAISGLDATFASSWRASVAAVATPAILESVTGAANTIRAAQEHTVGRLTDTQVHVAVSGTTATVTDCLDEYDWYAVEDASGSPDPAVTRGHFRGVSTLTETGGRWYVSGFQPSTIAC